ncbi:MAG: ABC transporter permease [Candidatus Riflebacteria bacterium]|nr:ABC transporter permease [Candidatus Riflebacteria bacterium]
MESLLESFWAIKCVWLRYFAFYRKNIVFAIITTFVEPLLYLLSFGFGVGGMVGGIEIEGIKLTYRQFVFAGVVAQTVLFQGFFEAAYGGFVRMYYQKVFNSIAMTPITLSEILWAELLWDASKAAFSASIVLLIGALSGEFSIIGSLMSVPAVFLFAMTFAGLGLLTAARSATIDDISYPQFLFIFPMFLFCGIFFPLGQMPAILQHFAWLLPLTSVVSIIRGFTLGLPFATKAFFIFGIWLTSSVILSRKFMHKRLVK